MTEEQLVEIRKRRRLDMQKIRRLQTRCEELAAQREEMEKEQKGVERVGRVRGRVGKG